MATGRTPSSVTSSVDSSSSVSSRIRSASSTLAWVLPSWSTGEKRIPLFRLIKRSSFGEPEFSGGNCRILASVDGRHTGDPPRLREGVRRLVARQLAENPALAFPDDTPEVVRSIAFLLIEDLVGYPLDWLVVSETAARHPDLRFPGLLPLSLAAEQILEVFSELGDDISLTATGLLSAQTMLLAKLLFLADHSRGVLDLTRDLRGHPAFPRALQVRDHFREATRRPPRPGDEARLVTDIATIAGIIPAAARIETQGSFW